MQTHQVQPVPSPATSPCTMISHIFPCSVFTNFQPPNILVLCMNFEEFVEKRWLVFKCVFLFHCLHLVNILVLRVFLMACATFTTPSASDYKSTSHSCQDPNVFILYLDNCSLTGAKKSHCAVVNNVTHNARNAVIVRFHDRRAFDGFDPIHVHILLEQWVFKAGQATERVHVRNNLGKVRYLEQETRNMSTSQDGRV